MKETLGSPQCRPPGSLVFGHSFHGTLTEACFARAAKLIFDSFERPCGDRVLSHSELRATKSVVA